LVKPYWFNQRWKAFIDPGPECVVSVPKNFSARIVYSIKYELEKFK
jgi:hypothetical protein